VNINAFTVIYRIQEVSIRHDPHLARSHTCTSILATSTLLKKYIITAENKNDYVFGNFLPQII